MTVDRLTEIRERYAGNGTDPEDYFIMLGNRAPADIAYLLSLVDAKAVPSEQEVREWLDINRPVGECKYSANGIESGNRVFSRTDVVMMLTDFAKTFPPASREKELRSESLWNLAEVLDAALVEWGYFGDTLAHRRALVDGVVSSVLRDLAAPPTAPDTVRAEVLAEAEWWLDWYNKPDNSSEFEQNAAKNRIAALREDK